MCTLPRSSGKRLAEYFNTKNPDDIAEGLRSVLAKQADIVDDQLQEYEVRGDEDMDSTLMRNLNQVFKNGAALHGLMKPKQGSQVQVNVGIGAGGTAQINSSEPREMAAVVVRELQDSLPPGTAITDDMVRDRLEQFANQEAIEGEVM